MFDYDTFSDLHKDVHGFRPSAIFMKNVKRFSDQERDDLWEALCIQLEENTKAEKAQEEADVAKFEARIQDVIELGAGNRTNALLWIIGTETFYHIQDVEHPIATWIAILAGGIGFFLFYGVAADLMR